ncbi:MAG: glutathione S-transferase family protein [Halofilum sp. (in: g-proteobacteria)]
MGRDVVLYGYDASSYVFSVRILLAEKGVSYRSVPLDVIAGEPQSKEHLARHPFGKVPVLECDGFRIIETSAILRYVNDAFEGPSFVPDNPVDRARMDMGSALYDTYGYCAMARIVGFHRFPAFVGHPDSEAVEASIVRMRTVLIELMRLRGDSRFIAGDRPSLADLFLAPACFYLELVEDGVRVMDVPGLDAWWHDIQQLEGYRQSIPDLRNWGECPANGNR